MSSLTDQEFDALQEAKDWQVPGWMKQRAEWAIGRACSYLGASVPPIRWFTSAGGGYRCFGVYHSESKTIWLRSDLSDVKHTALHEAWHHVAATTEKHHVYSEYEEHEADFFASNFDATYDLEMDVKRGKQMIARKRGAIALAL